MTSTESSAPSFEADISNKSLMTELQYKNEEIGRLGREINTLKRTVMEQAEQIKTLTTELNQKSDNTKLVEVLVRNPLI